MRFSPAVMTVCMTIVATGLAGQSPPIATTDDVYSDLPTVSNVIASGDEQRPDYSPEALLLAIWTDPYFDDDVPRAPRPFNPLQFTLFGQTFRFMPFLGSSVGSSSSAIPFDVVDPFSVAPISTPYTPHTFRDRFYEWRLRKMLTRKEKKKEDEE